jgi:hypothetical protein
MTTTTTTIPITTTGDSAMNKAEAKKLLSDVRAELTEKGELAGRLRAELLAVQERVSELQAVERYLSPLAGEQPRERLPEPAVTKRGEMRQTLDAAVAALGSETLTTGELADRLISAGYWEAPRGKLVSYLGTMLTRETRVVKVGKGTWRQAVAPQD